MWVRGGEGVGLGGRRGVRGTRWGGASGRNGAERWADTGPHATVAPRGRAPWAPKHSAATIAPRIMISSPTKVLDRVGCVEIWSKTVVEAKQLESMVLSLA